MLQQYSSSFQTTPDAAKSKKPKTGPLSMSLSQWPLSRPAATLCTMEFVYRPTSFELLETIGADSALLSAGHHGGYILLPLLLALGFLFILGICDAHDL